MEKLLLIYSMWSGYLSSEFDKQGHYKDLMDDPNVIFKILHTGGHSASEDLKRFISDLAPEFLLPFHTNSQEYVAKHKDELFVDFSCPPRLITELNNSELNVL